MKVSLRFSRSCLHQAISGMLGIGAIVAASAQSVVPPYPASFSLATLDGNQTGFRMNSATALAKAGHSVAGIGDINGDGIDDILVGAAEFPTTNTSTDPPTIMSDGRCYVIFGRAPNNLFSSVFNLDSITGNEGFTIIGSADERACFSVNSLRDMNGDSKADLIIGAPYADNRAGAAYVIFGHSVGNPFPAQLKLSDLDGNNGFRIAGTAAGAKLGHSVSSAGDMNCDGFGDILIGAPLTGDPVTKPYTGSAYVIFGKDTNPPNNPFPAMIDVNILDGTANSGFRIDGEASGDEFGFSVAPAGNINNDGNINGAPTCEDIIVGATGADFNGNNNSGGAFVLFGHYSSFGTNGVIDLSIPNTLNINTGLRIAGENPDNFLGNSVSGGGDVNGDGVSDIVVSAPFANPNPVTHSGGGSVYVIFGPTNYGNLMRLSNLNGINGFRIDGDTQDYAGVSLHMLEDLNGDGVDEILIGAPFANNGQGRAYVLFGRKTNTATFTLSALQSLSGLRGSRFEGIAPGDRTGFSVSSAGDINFDGINDIIIGASSAQPGSPPLDRGGSAFIVEMSTDRLFGSGFEKEE